MLQEQFKVVPKDIKDQKTIERWIQQLIQKGREYLAALAVSKRRAEESLSADPARQAEQMGIIRTILHGKGGGDPAPAV